MHQQIKNISLGGLDSMCDMCTTQFGGINVLCSAAGASHIKRPKWIFEPVPIFSLAQASFKNEPSQKKILTFLKANKPKTALDDEMLYFIDFIYFSAWKPFLD